MKWPEGLISSARVAFIVTSTWPSTTRRSQAVISPLSWMPLPTIRRLPISPSLVVGHGSEAGAGAGAGAAVGMRSASAGGNGSLVDGARWPADLVAG